METLACSATLRKPSTSYRAIVYDAPGALVKLDDGVLYFFGDDNTLTPFEAEMAPFTAVLGEIGLAETQALRDKLQGGYAKIACTRGQEVR